MYGDPVESEKILFTTKNNYFEQSHELEGTCPIRFPCSLLDARIRQVMFDVFDVSNESSTQLSLLRR